MDKTMKEAPDLVGGNTFGDDLEDNIVPPETSSRRAVSYTYGDEYPEPPRSAYSSQERTYDPAKRLEEIENTYRLVPPNHSVTIECMFKHKSPSDFYKNSKFVIWRDRSVLPNVYYWERKQNDAEPSPHKYGPFKEISKAFDAIKDIFGISLASDIERIT